MIASHICKDLYEWVLQGEKKGTIHSIFKNSVNIISEDNKLISVIGPNKPISPNGIKLKSLSSFDEGNLLIGERGQFTKSIFTSEHLNICYGNSILWDKKIDFQYEKDNLNNLLLKIQIIGKFILNHGNKSGIFTVLQTLPKHFNYINNILDSNYSLGNAELFIKDRFIEFIKSFEGDKLEVINENSKKIIGFGSGLTPFMDDFLSGLMIANIYIYHLLEKDIENAFKINQEIIRDMEHKTTLVSEEMLRTSSKGEANEDIKNLMMNLVGRTPLEEINKLSMKVANIGHSSGTDILCGIYIGSSILLSKIKGEYGWE